MQNIEGIGCNLPNALSRVLRVKDIVATGYKVCCDTRGRLRTYDGEIIGSYIYFKTTRAGWQLARVVMVAEDAESKELPHTIKLLDLGRLQRPSCGGVINNC